MTTKTAAQSDLYHELKGSGPLVVFISGATGDAEHFSRVCERLADEFTAVCYDRRGGSRSPKLEPDERMTIAAQADDAAALIGGLGAGPAVAFGTSGGGNILLELICRHPETLRAAIVHEPALIALDPNPQAGMDAMGPLFELAGRDPRAAMQAFIQFVTNDTALEALSPEHRERLLANGEHFFGAEIEAFATYLPEAPRVAAAGIPIQLLISSASPPADDGILPWFEQQLGLRPGRVSGHHAPYFDHPEVFAEELRPLLREQWADATDETK